MSHGITRACVILLLVAPVGVAISSAPAAADELSSILKAWESRHSSSVGVVVKWTESHEEIDIDWIRKHKDDADIMTVIKEGRLPVIKYDFTKRLAMTERYYRYYFKGEKPIDGVTQPQEVDIAFDGLKHVTFSAKYSRDERKPAALIYGAERRKMPPNSMYLPVILYARPFDTRLGGFPKDRISLRAESEDIDGRTCAIAQATNPTTTYTIWIDSSLEYAPVRVRAQRGEDLAFEVNIEYDRVETKRPSRWRLVENKHKGLKPSITTATIESWETGAALDVADFQIKLPVGTAVSEFSAGSERQYFIRPDGASGPPAK